MQELVMSHEEIENAAERIGGDLTKRLCQEKKLPVFICVMKGAMNWMIDLIEHVNMDIVTDYIQVSSYEGTSSTGKITLKKDITQDITGRVVVIVEDVIDTGLSMHYLLEHIKSSFKPKEVLVCALFDKQAVRKEPVKIDYVGKVLTENKFLVGYGLDYRGLVRNVPYVYIPTPKEVDNWDAIIEKDKQ